MKILYNQTIIDKLLGIRRVNDMVRIPKGSTILPIKKNADMDYTNPEELIVDKRCIVPVEEVQ